MGGQLHASAALPPGKDPVPIAQELEVASRPVRTDTKILAPTTGVRLRTVQLVGIC
jgi:hypothetical protein